ncbi:hydroxymethylglutaryl-CoA lyase, partial [Leptospira gomenensis]
FLEKSGVPTGIQPNLLWEATAYMEKAILRELQSRTYIATKKKRDA